MYSKNQFEKVCIGYLTRLTYAKLLCDIYCSMYAQGDKYADELKTAPNFFEVSFSAILHQALLMSANFFLFGQSNEFTLHKLMKILRSDSHLRRGCDTRKLDEAIRQGGEYLISREEIINGLIEWRNRYIAHHDKKYFIGQYRIDSETIDMNDLDTLLSFGTDFIYRIGEIMDMNLEIDNEKYTNDFPLLLKKISRSEG